MNKTQKTKKISAEHIADYFIKKGSEENRLITNKKLQKLLYYSQAWNLVFNNKPLFDEEIEAWVHGPVVRSIYFKFKDNGFNPIKDFDVEKVKEIDEDTISLLDEIWRVYGKFDAEYLEMLTHNEKPWQEARDGFSPYVHSEKKISLKSMKKYYSELLKDVSSKIESKE
ncbi:MAG: DUF4065 domain-containing protein [Candidatus Pacebacteria bacterium]|jgi:uncharacterized phage-associated protein|nr:DUF4065 domain-containing protein [Candidatus Paceibacterota bacterium]MDD3048325.1 DUF4065 domain-containing protein [Candidatus Paceibacterota bacterium]MDD3510243.1 DUF4065 domain-containing protein [Candidatus Paceibacterota bacterium]MDD3918894.1 DUF4065 domain-containing protein [Candidatus Paceibacterota bacterium]MDD4664917.1 DUF4065 domain-containing protein [Candidatus Paceibacterota bacterium]